MWRIYRRSYYPSKITIINDHAFYASGFNGLLCLPDAVTIIGDNAFGDSHIRGELVLPKNITKIGDEAFWIVLFPV